MSLLQIYWRALGYLAADRKRVAFICGANVALAIIAILEPIMFGRVIDAISDGGSVFSTLGAVGWYWRLQRRRLRPGGARRGSFCPCAAQRGPLPVVRARDHHAACLASSARHLQLPAYAAARGRDLVQPLARVHEAASVDGCRTGSAGADGAQHGHSHVDGPAGTGRALCRNRPAGDASHQRRPGVAWSGTFTRCSRM